MKTPLIHAWPLLLTLGACATTQQLHTESSTSAIRSAEESGAGSVPRAALHLQFAKEEMAAAKDLNEKGDKDMANSWLLRAEADAEMAVALSQAEGERIEAQAAVERVRKLQAENPYSPGTSK